MEIALMIVGLVAILFLAMGIDHRRQAKKNNAPIGPLWWHIREDVLASYRGDKGRPKQETDAGASIYSEKLTMLTRVLQQHNQNLSEALRERILRSKKKQRAYNGAASESPEPTGSFKNIVAAEHAIAHPGDTRKPEITVVPKPAAAISVQDQIRFIYRSDGQQSQREVKVRAIDGNYLKGFCLTRGQIRTFRLDRIVGKVTLVETGEVMSAGEWVRQVKELAREPTTSAVPSQQESSELPPSCCRAVGIGRFSLRDLVLPNVDTWKSALGQRASRCGKS